MEQISIQRLKLLHPKLRDEAVMLYTEAVRRTPVGTHPLIVQTLRTFEEQDALYQKGRTRPGPKVTNSKPGQSFHNFGLACDFCLQVNGKLKWTVNKDWMTVVNIFKASGWESGLDWKSFTDAPHLQRTFGYTWQQLLIKHKAGEVDENGYIII